MNPRVLPVFCVLIPAFSVLVSSCSSPDRAARSARLQPAITMRGETSFFDGSVRVETTVHRAVPRSAEDGEDGPRGRSGRRGHGRRGMGGPAHDSGDAVDSEPTGRIGLPHLSAPSLTLGLKLENTSRQPVDVQIRDVISELGSFAVRPERVQLAPGQSAELDPMVSELGVVAAEIPVTVVLRVGGKTESEVVVVKDIHASAPPPATAP